MRFLLVTDWLRRSGGMERYFETLREGLRTAGHEARLLTSTAGESAGGTADYRAYGSNAPAAQAVLQLVNPFAVASVRAAVRDFRPEAAIVGMVEQHLSPAVLAPLAGVPTILSLGDYKTICPVHSKLLPSGEPCTVPAGLVCWTNGCTGLAHWLRDRPRYALFRSAIARCDRVLACSEWLRRALAEAGIVAEAVPLPTPAVPPTYVREPSAQPSFLFVGRLSREKGVAGLLRAFARAREAVPAAELRLAGEGEERAELERLADELGIAEAVVFLGALRFSAVERELARAWAAVAPSLWSEPFGLVALEAVVRGVPTIASSRGGLAEVVEHGRSGLLFPNGDDEALARCLVAVGTSEAFPARTLDDAVVAGTAARHGVDAHVALLERMVNELRTRRAQRLVRGRSNTASLD